MPAHVSRGACKTTDSTIVRARMQEGVCAARNQHTSIRSNRLGISHWPLPNIAVTNHIDGCVVNAPTEKLHGGQRPGYTEISSTLGEGMRPGLHHSRLSTL